MFPDDRYNTQSFTRFYLFQSSLHGTAHSIAVFPSVSKVSPSLGSYAGGTLVTISGSGFSTYKDELTVYVAGYECTVVSATTTSIQCLTARAVTDSDATSRVTGGESIRSVYGSFLNSSRSLGSPGWWMKMWNQADMIAGRVGQDPHVKDAFGFRDKFYFSLYETWGYNWPSMMSFETNNYVYTLDAGAVFVAPYSGFYTFYVAADDVIKLYGSFTGIGKSEVIIAQTLGYVPQRDYYTQVQQISNPIALKKNQKYYLRQRLVS
jgi:hypothetical protein